MTTSNQSHPSVEQLQAFVKGHLPEEQAAPLESHLAQCAVCCEQLQQAGELSDALLARLQSALQDAPTGAFTPAELLVGDGSSVLRALSAQMDEVPRVHLHDPKDNSITPISRPSSEEMPDKQDFPGRYQLVGEIARGGMGAILKGRDTDLGRDIAVKVMLETHKGKTELLQRFVEEAQISGQLQHPGIVPVYEMGQSGDKRPYFTMKLVKGTTLAALLKQRDNPTEDLPKYLGIFEQICQTMAYAHARGVIHRDLKPANIMVGNFGEVQVMDWGLAKVLAKGGIADEKPDPEEATAIRTVRSEGSKSAESSDGSHTQAGSVLGTPAYMAPEQANGEVEALDERCDVFGLGAILCTILTGKPPYVGKNTSEVHKKAMQADLTDAQQRLQNCGADRELIDLTQQCLQVTKKDRLYDAGVLSKAVTEYLVSVQSRLKQAEIESAEANVKAKYEQKQRELAEGIADAERKQRELVEQKVISERKRRRATLVMAVVAFLLLGSLGLGGLAAWQQQNLEKTRYSTGIDRVYQLLKKYRYKEAKETANVLTKTLSYWVPQSLRKKLREAHKDIDLLTALDQVRQNRATIVDGHFFNSRHAAKQYEKTFQDFATKNDFPESKEIVSTALLKWLRSRPRVVSEQVSASLGDWIVCLANDKKQAKKRTAILTVVGRFNPTPLGSELLQKNVWDNPKKLVEQAASLDPKTVSAHLLHSIALNIRHRKGNQAAVKFLGRVQIYHPTNFWLLFTLANTYRSSKQPDLAISCYRAALAVRPTVAAAYNGLGNALFAKQDYDGAIVQFQKATVLAPNHAQYYTNWGIALRFKQDYDGAIAQYKKAISLNPKLSRTYNSWGNALTAKQDYDGAITKYKKAISLDPNEASTYYNWGNALTAKQDYDGAIAKFKSAISFNSKYAKAYNNWGLAFYHKQNYQEAIVQFQKAILLDPKDATIYFNWGNALTAKKDYEGAIVKYQKASILDPKESMTYYNWGNALFASKAYERAIVKYQKAISLNPNFDQAYTNWGNVLSARKNYDEAIVKYQKATTLNPKLAVAYSNWGLALRNKQDYDEAVGKFEKAISLDRKDSQTYYNWGLVLSDKLDYQGATAKYKLALKYNPTFPEANCNLGGALLFQGQFATALKYLRRGHKLGSQRGRAWHYPSAQWVKKCEQLLALDKKLTSIIQSQHLPTDPAELLRWAAFCRQYKKREPASMKLVKTIEARFVTLKTWNGTLSTKQKEQTYPQKLQAGKTYLIDMQSKQFDTYLRLEDGKGKTLKENDDIAPGNLNSRILFTPKQAGTYRIVATSFRQQGRGSYTLSIREFVAKN